MELYCYCTKKLLFRCKLVNPICQLPLPSLRDVGMVLTMTSGGQSKWVVLGAHNEVETSIA